MLIQFDRSYVGSIGVARRTHWLESFDPDLGWATSQCGRWAGKAKLAQGEPTCIECKRILGPQLTKDARSS